jgi:L-threonylcarbamoyladenylate synthase
MSATGIWRWGDPIEPLRLAVREGRMIAIPTESSYGLAVDPRSEEGVSRIRCLKGREVGKALPVVAADVGQIEALGASLGDPRLRALSERWPAPLSLLLPLARDLPASAGTGRLAVRVPAHEQLGRLLADLGSAMTATSMNRSGEEPLLDPREVARMLASEPGSWLVDGGMLPGGKPSTLVGVRKGQLEVLRSGAFPVDTLADVEGEAGEAGFSAGSVEIFADESR